MRPAYGASFGVGVFVTAQPVTVVVDAANVMGSRPDGWWRDRAGAAVRLHADLERIANVAVAVPGFDGAVLPEFVLVLEGAARAARPRIDVASVRVVVADGSGDDAIVATVREVSGPCVVVTADRELRRRCEALGAVPAGPGWLLDLMGR
jgi:8-oxo-dGTP diphosphatase